MLGQGEAQTLEALGETLALGARNAGIAHFVDQQLTVPPGHALLALRVSEARPPYVDFYRAALGGIERASQAQFSRAYADLTADERTYLERQRGPLLKRLTDATGFVAGFA